MRCWRLLKACERRLRRKCDVQHEGLTVGARERTLGARQRSRRAVLRMRRRWCGVTAWRGRPLPAAPRSPAVPMRPAVWPLPLPANIGKTRPMLMPPPHQARGKAGQYMQTTTSAAANGKTIRFSPTLTQRRGPRLRPRAMRPRTLRPKETPSPRTPRNPLIARLRPRTLRPRTKRRRPQGRREIH